uniref:Cytochrome P450 n=1 Tax=Arcella intermedia TaxID=1963864 RepID=A0A6B2L468_9EUKA
MSAKFGPTFKVDFFVSVVMFSQPEHIRTVLKQVDDVEKAAQPVAVQNLFKPLFGNQSIVHQNKPLWNEHRTILNKSFISNKVFFEPLQKKAKQCIDLWKTQSPVHVVSDLQKMTLDALGTCIFGRDFDTLGGNLSGPLQAYNNMIQHLFRPIFLLLPFLLKLPFYNNLKESFKVFDDYCWQIIRDSKQSANEQPHLISLMINNGLSDQVVRDNIGVFFLAGHETTNSTLSWAIGLLAQYPNITNKLREELAQKTYNFTKPLVYDDLKELVYLDWFIKETLRMYPATPQITARRTAKDMVIGEWFLPKHTRIGLDIVSMMHDKNIWGNPEVFDPERWSPDRLTKAQRSAYMPFSHGPRICIGMNFSLVEQKIFLSTLLTQFSKVEFSPGGSCLVDPQGVTNTPDKHKLLVRFQ